MTVSVNILGEGDMLSLKHPPPIAKCLFQIRTAPTHKSHTSWNIAAVVYLDCRLVDLDVGRWQTFRAPYPATFPLHYQVEIFGTPNIFYLLRSVAKSCLTIM